MSTTTAWGLGRQDWTDQNGRWGICDDRGKVGKVGWDIEGRWSCQKGFVDERVPLASIIGFGEAIPPAYPMIETGLRFGSAF